MQRLQVNSSPPNISFKSKTLRVSTQIQVLGTYRELMAHLRVTRPLAASLGLLAALACNAGEKDQVKAIDCSPEPLSRPAIDPGIKFWRTHPDSEVQVAFRFLVAPSGSVSEVRLLRDDYPHDYADETVKAVRKWAFKPFTCAPDGLWLQTQVTFVPPGAL